MHLRCKYCGQLVVAIPSTWGLISYQVWRRQNPHRPAVAIPSTWGLISYTYPILSRMPTLVAIPSTWGLISYPPDVVRPTLPKSRNPFYMRSDFLPGITIFGWIRPPESRNPFYMRSDFLLYENLVSGQIPVAIPSTWGLISYLANSRFGIPNRGRNPFYMRSDFLRG